MSKEYVLVESIKLAEIKYKALQKLAANKERPLSETCIEARAVIQVINTMYEMNEWFDIHDRIKSDKTGYQEY